MSEFNGKKFYGYSLQNDPALTTNTRNFEFRYARPEQLERAIQRAQMTDEAMARQRKSAMLSKFTKVKTPAQEIQFEYSRDIDVETHISRVRSLSENEVDLLIGKVKSPHAFTHTVTSGGEDSQCYATPDEQDEEMVEERQPHSARQIATMVEYDEPQPKWVEILEASAVDTQTVADVMLPTPSVVLTSSTTLRQYPEELPCSLQVHIPGNTSHDLNKAQTMPAMCYDENNTQAYYDVVEDSDLEFEMMGRSNYAKYCGPRPKSEEMINVSNENSEGYPQFVEMEQNIPYVGAMSFLKNTAPIRYTDFAEETPEERVNTQMKAYMQGLQPNEAAAKESSTKHAEEPKKKSPRPKVHRSADKSPDKKSLPSSPRSKRVPNSDNVRTAVAVYASRGKLSPKQNSPRSASNRENSARNSTDRNKERPKVRNMSTHRSIEELKMEKIVIFNRMANTQERIIELLDKLRYNLLEINVPENSYEKSRRQRNAFEFSVRFSRNFLYPLKGMVDDLRLTTKEQLNSCSSNEACSRLSSIYCLLLQSLQTYQKQLRYFLLDQVPQKLTTLIEMIHTTTSISLEKGVFDKHDVIIECLQERCSKFHSFLVEMHEERFKTVRANYRKMNLGKACSSKYDLKMCMNDLNMYEPKLVPRKNINRRSRRNLSTTDSHGSNRKRPLKGKQRSASRPRNEDSSDMLHLKTTTTPVQTLIQNNDDGCSSGMLCSAPTTMASCPELGIEQEAFISNLLLPDKTSDLNKAIIEALHVVTRDQVHQVMKPIIESLGIALDKKKNSEIIETILSAFNSKVLSSVQAESERRCDADTNAVQMGTVASPRVGGKISTSSMRNTSKALKTAKQTNQSKHNRHRESNEALEVDTAATTATAVAAATTRHRGTDDDDDDDESEVDNNNSDSDSDNSDNDSNSNGKHSSHKQNEAVERYERMAGGEETEESTSALESDDESCHFDVIVVNPKQKQQTLNRDNSVKQAATMAAITAAAKQITLHELVQQQPLSPQKKRNNKAFKLQAKPNEKQRPSAQRVVSGSSSSANTSFSTLRPHNVSGRFNRRLFKKRRNPLQSPPPPPTVTPSTSARSRKENALQEYEQLSPKKHADKSHGFDVAVTAGAGVLRSNALNLDCQQQEPPNESESNMSFVATKDDAMSILGAEAAPTVPLTCNFNAMDKLPDHQTPSQLNGLPQSKSSNIIKVLSNCLFKGGEVQLKPAAAMSTTTTTMLNPSKNASKVFTEVFKDVKQKSLPLYTQDSPYKQTSGADDQLQRLKALKKEIRQQERKQQAQRRALNSLNSVADSFSATAQSNCREKPIPEADTADGINRVQSTKLDLKVNEMIKERDQFMNLCSANRFYSNPNYEEPWKVFSKISDKLANEVVNAVEEDFTLGVSKFVKDFLELETQT